MADTGRICFKKCDEIEGVEFTTWSGEYNSYAKQPVCNCTITHKHHILHCSLIANHGLKPFYMQMFSKMRLPNKASFCGLSDGKLIDNWKSSLIKIDTDSAENPIIIDDYEITPINPKPFSRTVHQYIDSQIRILSNNKTNTNQIDKDIYFCVRIK